MNGPLLRLLASSACLLGSASAQTLPAGFEIEVLPGNWGAAIGLTFLENGDLFFYLQDGRVFLHHGASYQPAPVIDLRDEVNKHGDRGMLGLAAHPGFMPDGGPTSWIYLLYTVSPVPGQDVAFDFNDQYSFSRLTRYRTRRVGATVSAILPSRQVLLGVQEADGSVPLGIPSLHESHSNGSLVFGEDGTLLVATGDGAHFDSTDVGGIDDPGFDDWIHPVTLLAGPTPKAQDVGAFRSQSVDSLAGKILRIDPATGFGLPSNPFYDGDVQSIRSRVWALGLRNPFRTTLLAGTGSTDPAAGDPGTLLIGDVGNQEWEEINTCLGGENFGWPCREGQQPAFGWSTYDPPGADPPPCSLTLEGTLTEPSVAVNHNNPTFYHPPATYQAEDGTPLAGFQGICTTGAVQYKGGAYPSEYVGRIFFSDFGFGWIKTLELDDQGQVVAIRPFAEGWPMPTTLAVHPITGDLYVGNNGAAKLSRIRYVAPDAVQTLGCGVNPPASLAIDAAVEIGHVSTFTIDNPLDTQSPGAMTLLGLSAAPDAAYPCGTQVPGYGMSGAFAVGEMLIDVNPGNLLDPIPGPAWTGAPTALAVPVPYLLSLFGQTIYAQGVILDPTAGGGAGPTVGLTEALELKIGS